MPGDRRDISVAARVGPIEADGRRRAGIVPMLTVRPAAERGSPRLAGFTAASFSFGEYHDPRHMGVPLAASSTMT